MRFDDTRLSDAKLVQLAPRGDARAAFTRTFCARTFAAAGLVFDFPQHNASVTALKGSIRGLHRQLDAHAETKLIRCLRGAIYDVIVDLRPRSPTFRRWQAFELSAGDGRALYAPAGFAHGFQTLQDDVEVAYLVSAEYAPAADAGVRWDDPAFAIDWPLPLSAISEKDAAWPDFSA